MGNTLTIRLPEELDRWLEEQVEQTGLSKSQIVREQLELSRTRKARQPFLDLAGAVEGDAHLSRKRGFAR
jgi:Arc/MetJ-type ribon-helix-helix transcriptional regulator